jgi:multiple sugar transport system permease protein
MTKQRKKRFFSVVRYTVLTVWLVIIMFPIYWMVQTSFKPADEWFTWPPMWFPRHFTLDNFRVVWLGGHVSYAQVYSTVTELPYRALMNSSVIAGTATFCSVALGLLLAYSVSRYRALSEGNMFKLLMLRMMPPIVVAIPVVIYYSTLHLLDTRIGLILVYIVTTIPYSAWMTKSFLDEVPVEIEQSAQLLGASKLRTVYEIVFPLILSGVVATFMFVLILTWSEYLLGLVITSSQAQTLPVTLGKYEGATEGRLYGWQAALSIGVTLPLIVFGYLIHKHLVRGFSFGMIKR